MPGRTSARIFAIATVALFPRFALAETPAPLVVTVTPPPASGPSIAQSKIDVRWESLKNQSKRLYAESRYTEALTTAQQALSIALANFPADDLRVGVSHNNVAANEYAMGNYRTAFDNYEKAIVNYELVLGKDSHRVAIVLSNQGEAARFLDIPEIAETTAMRAIGIYEKLNDPAHHALRLAAYSNIASLKLDRFDFDGAEAFQARALALAKMLYGEKSSETANAHIKMAGIMVGQGNAFGAKASYLLSIPILERELGSDHIDVAFAKEGLSDALLHLDELTAALKVINDALDSHIRRFGSDSHNLSDALFRRSEIYRESRDFIAAERDILRAENLLIENFGEQYSRVFSARFSRSMTYLAQKRYVEAEQIILDIVKYHEERKGAESVMMDALAALVDVYHETGRIADRDAAIVRLAEIRGKHSAPDTPLATPPSLSPLS